MITVDSSKISFISHAMQEYNQNQDSAPFKIVTVGHVDDGKSTLIGRLLHETGSFPEGKMEEIKNMSEKRGMGLEWSFALDSFQAERDQAITLDTTRIHLKTKFGPIILIDTPGHIEFLKNMVSGAADANAALLLVDAHEGVREQTRRHSFLLHFLGIRQIAVLINKMDLVGYSEKVFLKIRKEVSLYLKELKLKPIFIIPISARFGDNIVTKSKNMAWYNNQTVLQAIGEFKRSDRSIADSLRFPIQDVYKFDEKRILSGRIEYGSLKVGDNLIFSPSNKTACVKSIETWNSPSSIIPKAGASIGITLDKQIFVERGEIASHQKDLPHISNVFSLTTFWLGNKKLQVGKQYKLRLSTQEALVTIQDIENQIDIDTLEKHVADDLEKNTCGTIVIRSNKLLAIDDYNKFPKTGRCVLIEDQTIVGAGMVNPLTYPDQRKFFMQEDKNITQVKHQIDQKFREEKNGHSGGVLWFTGLSGSGKSTLAMNLEKYLFNKGYQVYVLDGDNIRGGLNSDLYFSPDDRSENIRRVAEVAKLFSDAGFICITAFISPYESDRAYARNIVKDRFHEVYIKCDLKTCENRDVKGLYKKAKSGIIEDFTGISAPYEEPKNPDITIETSQLNIEECLEKLARHIGEKFPIKLGCR